MASNLNVEVVYATATQQNIVKLELAIGSTIRQAVLASGLYHDSMGNLAVGIFGKQRGLDFELQDGDRVEIYSALFKQPNEARKERAKNSKRRRKK